MPLLPALVFGIVAVWGNQVTVTRQAALERFSPDGQVVDICEALPGEKFTFVSFYDKDLILMDDSGTHYRIAQAATDYALAPDDADTRGGPVMPEDVAKITLEANVNLDALVEDRPELLTLMQPQDDVWTWLQVHFTNGGWTIRWSNDRSRLSHYLARHTYASDGHPVIFLARELSDGTPVSAEAQLSGLVFELLNAMHEYEFEDVAAQGSRGELNRKQFVLANARIEFAVCHETQDFYRQVWRPHVLRNHLSDRGGNWHLSVGDNFAKWIAYHRTVARDGYPDDVYEPEYDAIMAKRHATAAK